MGSDLITSVRTPLRCFCRTTNSGWDPAQLRYSPCADWTTAQQAQPRGTTTPQSAKFGEDDVIRSGKQPKRRACDQLSAVIVEKTSPVVLALFSPRTVGLLSARHRVLWSLRCDFLPPFGYQLVTRKGHMLRHPTRLAWAHVGLRLRAGIKTVWKRILDESLESGRGRGLQGDYEATHTEGWNPVSK